MRDFVFTSIFLSMALLALRHAHLGMMLWVWSALLPPNEFFFGFAQSIPFNKISAACTLLALLFDRRKTFSLNPLLICLLMFLAEVSLAYVHSPTPVAWGSELYERLAKTIVAAIFIRFVAVDRLRLHSILLAAGLAVGTGTVDESLKFLVTGGGHHVKGPTSWGDENITATMILMIIPIIAYMYRYSPHRLVRQIYIVCLLLCAVGVVGTYSRGGFIGLVVSFVLLTTNVRRRFAALLVVLIVAGVGLSLAPDTWAERISTTQNAGDDGSFMQRVVQWKILLLMALDHPFLGGGILANMVPETWASYAIRLASELTFIITPPPSTPLASHSIYFQVLGENGFTGLFLFLLVFILAFRIVAVVKQRGRREPDLIWAVDMAVAIRTSLVLFLVTGAALPIPYLEFPYLLLGALSAIEFIQRKEMTRTRTTRKEPSSG